jgi:hypothetical protein
MAPDSGNWIWILIEANIQDSDSDSRSALKPLWIRITGEKLLVTNIFETLYNFWTVVCIVLRRPTVYKSYIIILGRDLAVHGAVRDGSLFTRAGGASHPLQSSLKELPLLHCQVHGYW